MKTHKQLEEQFEKDVEELQNKCKHQDVSDWMDQWWAVGHTTGYQVKVCNICNKIIEKRKG